MFSKHLHEAARAKPRLPPSDCEVLIALDVSYDGGIDHLASRRYRLDAHRAGVPERVDLLAERVHPLFTMRAFEGGLARLWDVDHLEFIRSFSSYHLLVGRESGDGVGVSVAIDVPDGDRFVVVLMKSLNSPLMLRIALVFSRLLCRRMGRDGCDQNA